MSNPVAYFGLKPIRHLNGMPWNGQVKRVYFKSTTAGACYIGDIVDINGSSDTAGEVPDVILGTVGDNHPIYGVIVGFEPNPDDLTQLYRPTLTERYAWACVDPDVIYAIRDDGAAALTADSVGLNAVLIQAVAGSTITGLSGMALDTNSDVPSATATNQLLILNKAPIGGNDLDKNAVWEVLISRHRLRPVAGILGA